MVMAEFIFHSEGKMLFGMPYVAKLHVNDYYEIEKEFMLCNPVIDKDGDITVDIEYSAENFDIIEEDTALVIKVLQRLIILFIERKLYN